MEHASRLEIDSRLRHRERGATMIEYALLVALISIIAIAAVRAVGMAVSDEFTSIEETISDPGNADGDTPDGNANES